MTTNEANVEAQLAAALAEWATVTANTSNEVVEQIKSRINLCLELLKSPNISAADDTSPIAAFEFRSRGVT